MADDRPSNDQMFRKTFVHINSSVCKSFWQTVFIFALINPFFQIMLTAQFQAEEVAVEHLLRDLEHSSFSNHIVKVIKKLFFFC
jgi:hypothetical protein